MLDAIAELLGGRPTYDEKGRFAEAPLAQIRATQLRAGMCVRPFGRLEMEYRAVTRVEQRELDTAAHFARGVPLVLGHLGELDRRLTDEEIDRADVYLAQHIGRGAVRE